MDNMRIRLTDPAEDEFALSVLSLTSPLLGWTFPEKESYFDRYLSFDDCSDQEIAQWKNALNHFIRKLTLHYQKPLILKSPHHTARIKLLLEEYPKARFIHIHRDPYLVFRSTRNLYKNTVSGLYLQPRPKDSSIEQSIIDRYTSLYEAFFAQKDLIPAGQFYEVSFRDLSGDFEGEIKKIYDFFHWNGWNNYREKLAGYLGENKNYKKNVYEAVEEPWKSAIRDKWNRYFEIWGYNL
jgi:hypothetical protein